MVERKKRSPKARRGNKPGAIDFPLLFISLAILAFGLIMVLSAGSVLGFNTTDNPYYYLLQQLRWAIGGAVLAAVVASVPYHFWRKFAGVGIFISLILLVAVLGHAGVVAKGSSRWLRIAGLSVQPSEFAKLAIVLFYAHILDRYPIRRGKDLLLPVGILLPFLFLIYKQPDLGTTLVIAVTSFCLLLQTELPTAWFAAAVPTFMLGLYYLVHRTPYQWQRIQVWLNPWAYASDLGYQITNAEIAFGSGGLLGVGLGRSLQKYGFLPENHTDTIFAIVGEELGLWGTTLLLVLFILLFTRGYYIARRCPDRFGRLLGFGITSALAVQMLMNVAVVTGLFPLTGITLPLISYGGSSLLITLVELGILLNISRYRKATVPQLENTTLSV